jgi:hypothetical protein
MASAFFKVGDVVRWNGIAAKFFCEETAIVVAVFPNKHGIQWMDEYAVVSSSGHVGTYFAGELERVLSSDRVEGTNRKLE